MQNDREKEDLLCEYKDVLEKIFVSAGVDEFRKVGEVDSTYYKPFSAPITMKLTADGLRTLRSPNSEDSATVLEDMRKFRLND